MEARVRRATLEETIRGLRHHDWRNHRTEAFRADGSHDDGFECACRPAKNDRLEDPKEV